MKYVSAVKKAYKKGGISAVFYAVEKKVRTIKNTIKRTKFPLRGRVRNEICRSLERSRDNSTGESIKHAATNFPSVEELISLWPIVYSQQRTLYRNQTRHSDLCPDMTLSNIRKGRIIQKNLFEIWLFLREDPSTILEIGCRVGQSLINKMVFHTDPGNTTVFCLDLFIEGGSRKFIQNNLNYLGVPTNNFFFFEGDSKRVVPLLVDEFPKLMFDYVLVDGSHHVDDAYQDLINVIPLIRPGGYLVFDDTGPEETGHEGYGLIKVWDEAMSVYGREFDVKHYDIPYGFCVGRKLSKDSTDFDS